MAFLYETHIHTKEGSACGVSEGREYARKYLDLGYTGIIVTDHFFRGNCQANRSLPWKEWVHEFCKGYDAARNEGARLGLDVFFGWEETIGVNDYLIYGLNKEWLLEHPEVIDWSLQEQFETVRRNGGCVVHAHPCRYANNNKRISVSKKCVDGVEVANSGNNKISDALALTLAKELKVSATAGSDVHRAADIWPHVVYGVYLNKKMETITDYVDAVLNNRITGLKVPDGHFDYDTNS